MSNDPFDAIPAARHDIARSALVAALGSVPIDAVTPISGGASGALIFRVDSGGRCTLLRIEGTPSPLRNPHQYVSMRIAAEEGIAPRLLYVDEANGVAMTDFIEQKSLDAFPGGPRALAQALGALLVRLQATPVFPAFVDYPDIVSRLFAHVRRTGLFAPGLLDPHAERVAQIAETWEAPRLVSSHNDANLRNVLFDGERLWLVDWESAYRNDPLVDVAILLDELGPSPEVEDVFLRAWLGRAPDDALRIRLALIRSLTRLYYAGVLLSASATHPRAAPDADLSAPSLQEFQGALRDERLTRGTREAVHIAGKMYLSSFLTGAAVPPLASL